MDRRGKEDKMADKPHIALEVMYEERQDLLRCKGFRDWTLGKSLGDISSGGLPFRLN